MLLSLWLLTVSLLAFSEGTAQSRPFLSQGRELAITESADGGSVELRDGQILAITLRANPSTGYSWQVERADESILREVGEPEFQADSRLLGAPGVLTLRFQARTPGITELRLVYRRPWENAEPAQTFSLQIQTVGPIPSAELHPEATLGPDAEPEGNGAGTPEQETADTTVSQVLPTAFNWCSQGGCTPVRNQGNCGSCWAFATVGPLESQIRLNDGLSKDLAEQYLLSCNVDGYDCDGGWWAHDYHAWKTPPLEPGAGAVYEADFAYTANDAVACNPPHAHHEKILSWAFVGPVSGVPPVAELKQAIFDHGPVAAAVCVNDAFRRYGSGVFTGPGCDDVNHGIVLVGWDDTRGAGGAWRLRNSWGSAWGEGGYMWIAYGVSRAGYGANYVSYPSRPKAPGNLLAARLSLSSIQLRWSDNSNNENGFIVERSTDGATGWTDVATLEANVTAHTDGGLPPDTAHYYRVLAYNAYGESAYSNVAQATTFQFALYVPLALRNAP